jgi:hypothetical protein
VNPANGFLMSWHEPITERLADVLKFFVRGAILISSIACSFTATYIIVKLCWWTARWLDRIWFSTAW